MNDHADVFRLRRGVFGRLLGVSGASFFWWAVLYAQVRLLLAGDLYLDSLTIGITVVCVACAVVEGTASASVTQDQLTFRNTLKVHRVPVGDIGAVLDGLTGFSTGAFRAVSIQTKATGGWMVVRPTQFIGEKRRQEFLAALTRWNPEIKVTQQLSRRSKRHDPAP